MREDPLPLSSKRGRAGNLGELVSLLRRGLLIQLVRSVVANCGIPTDWVKCILFSASRLFKDYFS